MQLSHELSVFLASSSGFWRANSEWTSSDGMAISSVQVFRPAGLRESFAVQRPAGVYGYGWGYNDRRDRTCLMSLQQFTASRRKYKARRECPGHVVVHRLL